MKVTLNSTERSYVTMIIKQDFYCKKVFHDLLNLTCKSRGRLHKQDQDQEIEVWANLLETVPKKNETDIFFYIPKMVASRVKP